MKKINIVIFLFCYLNLYSQQQSILWKIEKDSVTSYIIGTNHLFGESFLKKDKVILLKIEESNLVLAENIGESYSIINVREDSSSTGFLNQDQLKLLENISSKKTSINKLQLREIMIIIDEVWAKKSCLNNRERKDSLSLDNFIIKTAQEKGIKVGGLEDPFVALEYINKYTYEEYDYIYNHYNTDGAAAVAEQLDRSVPSIENKAAKLGLVNKGVFTANELQLAKKYGNTLGDAMVFLLPERTVPEIREMIACANG